MLKILTPNQPAARYLYLRYVITFLHQQKLGNTAWLDRVCARGYLWATPGPYLRQTMLAALARRVSDYFLPEVFYESTFTAVDTCPQRSQSDEKDLAMGLDHKVEEALTLATHRRGSDDKEESDESDYDSE